MKLRKHSWILIPLAIVLGILLGRSGYLERAFGDPLEFMAITANNAWDRLRETTYGIYDRGTIHDYVKSHAVRKLQIGAGGNDPDGWLNSDVSPKSNEIFLDATRPYPFSDGSFQYIFSEHVIEHLTWEGGVAMLRECHRVLAPGGRMRTVTPNLRKFVDLVERGAGPDDQRLIAAKLRIHRWPVTRIPEVYFLNGEARDWGHQFLYDPAALRKSLEMAGFQQITEYPVAEKTDTVFREAERRAREPGSDLWLVNNWEAMAFEATR